MNIGIVGNEGAKFTKKGEIAARSAIRNILQNYTNSVLVSGGCHLGGIDIYAEEIADELKIPKLIFKPENQRWADGYKPRNIKIANKSDVIYNIVVKRYPNSYNGMKFNFCYHCKTKDHIKSGGCWTAHRVDRSGKQAYWILIENEE